MKVALAIENPSFIEGVKKGFGQFFTDCQEQRVNPYLMCSVKGFENIGKRIVFESNRKLWFLRTTIEENYDFLVAVEDGLMINKGEMFYSVNALIQPEEEREVEYWGTSCGIMIPYEDQKDVINKRFSEVFSDEDLIAISKGRLSYAILAQQAVEAALISMTI